MSTDREQGAGPIARFDERVLAGAALREPRGAALEREPVGGPVAGQYMGPRPDTGVVTIFRLAAGLDVEHSAATADPASGEPPPDEISTARLERTAPWRISASRLSGALP